MKIGEPLRTSVVESLEFPCEEPQEQAEPTASEPETETERATK